MNIAIVSYHTMGGSGVVAYELGTELARMGHNIHFLGLEPPFRMNGVQENVMFHSVEVEDYPVFTYPPYTLALASKLYEVIELYDIDTVHCHYAVPHAVAGLLAKQMTDRDVTVVTTLHGTDITLVGSHPSFYSTTKWAIENSDCVTAVSEYLKKATEETFKLTSSCIRVIPNFVNLENFNPDQPCKCLDGMKKDKKVIVHASNLRDVKEPLDLIHIFKKVCEELGSAAELWILGEGPRKTGMEQLAREFGIEKQVRFFGVTSNPASFFASADIFMMTSREESFGLAALEAMACRTTVVSYGTGGIPEVVLNRETGILCDYKDIEGMASASIELLSDPGKLEQFKDASLKRAAGEFDKNTIVTEYLNLCSD